MWRTLAWVLLASAPAWADPIYRWTDGQGVEHYTNDPSTVPADGKARIVAGAQLGKEYSTDVQPQVYRWRDPQGVDHYTDDANRARSGATNAFASEPDRMTPPPMVEADEQDVAENEARAREAERRWRSAFQDVRARIATIQQQLPEARRRWQESQDQDEWYRWRAEVGQLEGRLRSAQSELAFLDKAARQQGVPDDWRR